MLITKFFLLDDTEVATGRMLVVPRPQDLIWLLNGKERKIYQVDKIVHNVSVTPLAIHEVCVYVRPIPIEVKQDPNKKTGGDPNVNFN
jgi:hypothetical protein